MKASYLLASSAALLVWTTCAHAQTALGTPVVSEGRPGPKYSAYSTPLIATDVGVDSRPRHPMLNSFARRMLTPIRAATGHLMPPPPPAPSVETPTKDEVARMIAAGDYSLAEISAAKIKIDESQANTRRAAVRFLGTVDCHYYPEAELGLIAALRADRVEGVRFEAALAIAKCRGVTPRMLEALNVAAQGTDMDGNPGETSERVRIAARNALSKGVGMAPAEVQPMLPAANWYLPDPNLQPMLPATNWYLPDPILQPMMPTPTWFNPEVSMQPMMPAPSWYLPQPNLIEPVNYFMPAPTYRQEMIPMTPPIFQHERDLAEKVSVTPPRPSASAGARPFRQFLQAFRWSGESSSAAQKVDPRLRGLAPLGSEVNLAIPSGPSQPVLRQPISAYNRGQ